MEAERNTYIGAAKSNYLYAKAGMTVGEESGDYNGVAALCAQAAEMMLKAVVEISSTDIKGEEILSLLHSHNLRRLMNKVLECYPSFAFSSKDAKWLGDFYFDARYPGDNFVVVSREDAVECLRLTEELENETEKILEKVKEKRAQKRSRLDDLDTFELE